MRPNFIASLNAGLTIFVLLAFPVRSDAGFNLEVIDTVGDSNGNSSIKTDAAGNPHVIYSARFGACGPFSFIGGFRYGTRTGGTWTSETLFDGGCPVAGGHPSLALDSAGNLGLVFVRYRFVGGFITDLVYATRSGGSWSYEIIETRQTGNVPFHDPRLVFDASDQPCVSYTDSDFDRLDFAIRIGGTWSIEVVDAVFGAEGYTSLALDPAGVPCISYATYDSGTIPPSTSLRYATRSGGNWSSEQVETANDLNGCTFLCVDSQSRPHLAYARPSGSLAYAVKNGGVWTIITVPVSAGLPAADVYLALDASERPHMVFQDRATDRLLYAFDSGSGWVLLQIDDHAKDEGSLSIDNLGRSQISYFKTTPLTANYAVNAVAAGTPDASFDSALRLRLEPNPAAYGTPSILAAQGATSIGSSAFVEVIDVMGRRVARLDPVATDGSNGRFAWDARVPAGAYGFRLMVDGRSVASTRGIVIR